MKRLFRYRCEPVSDLSLYPGIFLCIYILFTVKMNILKQGFQYDALSCRNYNCYGQVGRYFVDTPRRMRGKHLDKIFNNVGLELKKIRYNVHNEGGNL